MVVYNHFSIVGFGYIFSSKDMLIIRLGSYMSILGVEPIVLAIIAPNGRTNLNYLTNMSRIKDREMRKRYKLLNL